MKNLQPQTGPGQNIFHFLSFWLSLHVSFCFIIFHLHFLIISGIMVYHFLSLFIILFSFFHNFIMFFHFYCFHLFLSFFICLLCFIIFASSGAHIFQKMENCNFLRVFIMFYHFSFFLSCFIVFASSGAKNSARN